MMSSILLLKFSRTPSGRATSAVDYLGRDYYTARNNSRQQGGAARPAAAANNIREYGPYGDDFGSSLSWSL